MKPEKHLSGFDPDPNDPRGEARRSRREAERRCKIIMSGREDQGDSNFEEGATYDEREGRRLSDRRVMRALPHSFGGADSLATICRLNLRCRRRKDGEWRV